MDYKRHCQGRAVILFGALLVFVLGLSQSVRAGGLTISPVMIELESSRKAVAITLTNGGDTTLTFQSRALIWQQVDGVDSYAPTDALLVAPAIIDIPPQSSQVFRVALRRADPVVVEQSFRLLLEDVSRSESGEGKPAVALRLIHSLPLFVAPSTKTVLALRWSPCDAGGKSGCVRISNVGNRHVKIRSVTIGGERWERQLDVPGTLLAGSWREWKFARQQGDADITKIAVQNDREVLLALRETTETPGETMTAVAADGAVADPCTPQALEAIAHAQASAQDAGKSAADRIAVLQSCAAGINAATR